MKMLLYVLAALSLLLNVYLLCRTRIFSARIARITAILREIRIEGSNRRIHTGAGSQALEPLGEELNRLIDRFTEIIEKKQALEISHKQLTANISHDIRTPLTSLLGYVEILQNEEDLGAEDRRKFLDIIEKKGQSLYRMIQEFFELSKLESDDAPVKFEKVNLTETINSVLASCYADFIQGGTTLDLDVPVTAVFVFGDAEAIERVLQNLISNALKYGCDGGKVGIALRQDGEKVWVEVWDNGKGIPEADLKFVFDRLYTAESSRNGKLKGSGLGLAITRKLVEKLKGGIRVTSEPGTRTSFSFYLLKYR